VPVTGYRLIDADAHYYEPADCFTRHIESRFRDRTIHVRRGDDGLGRIFRGDRRTFMSVLPGDYASAPGALQGLFVGGVADGFTHREVINAKDHPEFTERPARIALLDEQGVEATIMLPTLGVAVEYDLREDVELNYASLRAFNRWVEEDWGHQPVPPVRHRSRRARARSWSARWPGSTSRPSARCSSTPRRSSTTWPRPTAADHPESPSRTKLCEMKAVTSATTSFSTGS
jgi:hypothetical protein